jgi:hypothetical protein
VAGPRGRDVLMRYVERAIWVALRLVCIALAAPQVYPSWPESRQIRRLVAMSTIVAAALVLTLVFADLIPIGVICADAFAFCRW